MQLPFPNESFDVVTMGFTLRNLPDYSQALQEAHRVLRPGGKIAVLDLGRPPLLPLRLLYYLAFFLVAPLVGVFNRGNVSAYFYLPRSLMSYPPRISWLVCCKRQVFWGWSTKTYPEALFVSIVVSRQDSLARENGFPTLQDEINLHIGDSLVAVEGQIQDVLIEESNEAIREAVLYALGAEKKEYGPSSLCSVPVFCVGLDPSSAGAAGAEMIHLATLLTLTMSSMSLTYDAIVPR